MSPPGAPHMSGSTTRVGLSSFVVGDGSHDRLYADCNAVDCARCQAQASTRSTRLQHHTIFVSIRAYAVRIESEPVVSEQEGYILMGTIVVLMHLTLDGVMQAPGRQDEDQRDGFAYGGWATPRGDAVIEAFGGIGKVGGMLFGRRTYEDFYSFWPNQTDNPFTSVLDATQKYVASTTLQEPLPWSNSTLLTRDVVSSVADLKQQMDQELLVMGSGVLIQSLMQHHLVDTYVLLIHPLVLGSGRRLFVEGVPLTEFHLSDTKTTTNGVVVATYQATTAARGIHEQRSIR